MTSDGLGPLLRAAWEQPGDLARHLRLEAKVLIRPAGLLAQPSAGPHLFVGQAFLFRVFDRGRFDENPLALIALSRTTEANDHRGEASPSSHGE